MRIDPTIFQEAMDNTGARTPEELGYTFLQKTGPTIRSYMKGDTVPDLKVCMILKKLTGRPIDSMVIDEIPTVA